MKNSIILMLLIFSINNVASQIKIANSDYEFFFNSDQKKIYNLWTSYLEAWNVQDKQKLCSLWKNECDLLSSEGFFNPSLYELGFENQVLKIEKIDEEKFKISSIFYWVDENYHFKPMAIVNVIAIKNGKGEFLLDNYLTYSTKGWKSRNVGNINYHFSKQNKFNYSDAKKANLFLNNLKERFNLNNLKTEYYIFENCQELNLYRGFSFFPVNNEHCAFFDSKNKIVYTTKFYGEFHHHELIHHLNSKFESAHYLLLSGISIYHSGKNVLSSYSLQELFSKLEQHILEKNIVQFNIFNFPTFEIKVTGDYLVGAILVDIIIEKGGKEMLLRALETTRTDEELESFILNELSLSNEKLNLYILQKIKEMSSQSFKIKI